MKKIKEDVNKEKEDGTMMAVTKSNNNQAFVLCEKKVESFLKQNNEQFKNAMARFKKIKENKKS